MTQGQEVERQPVRAEVATAAELDDTARAATRDLILVLADSKRLLGMCYADWTLGAPELEAGIACASMAQDEWGHARQLYAMLRDFGDDLEQLEHGREPSEYCSMVSLDARPSSWAELVVLNTLADTALSVQVDALRDSAYGPLRQRSEKLLDEERFHAAHGAAWFRRMSEAGDEASAALREIAGPVLTDVMQWFGPMDARARALTDAGVVAAGPDELRCTYAGRIGPLLDWVGIPPLSEQPAPDHDGFDAACRRPAGRAGPDARTIEQARGDRNRAFLMD